MQNIYSINWLKRVLSFLMLASLACSVWIPAVGAEPVTTPNASVQETLYTAYSHSAEIVPGQVLVKYKRAPRTLLGAGGYAAESLASADGRPIYRLSFAEEISVTEKLEQLQQDANVEYAEPVYRVSLPKPVAAADRLDPLTGTVVQSVYNDPANPTYMRNWGKTVTELTYAAAQTTPEQRYAVVVAVVDSGVDLHHPDLAGSLVPGYDFVNDDDTPQDDNGHGTGTAGIIAARAHDASGYDGVAPGAKIMPIKVMDSEGHGDTATIVRGIQYAIDHHADMINMSLGSQIPSRAMQDIVQAATKQGILVVAAAGNDSNHWIGNEPGQLDDPSADNERYAYYAAYPAYYDEVLSVGAVEQLSDSTLTIADFSNIGKVDVVAPGVHIYTTDLNGGYAYRSGTSESAPIVTGYAALLKAYNPKLTREDLTAIVKDTSRHELNDPGHTYDYANFPSSEGKYVDVGMDYGRGIINGRIPFNSPRLKVIPVTGTISSDRTVTTDVYWLDLAGRLAPQPSTVTLKMTLVAEDEPEFTKDTLVGINAQDILSGFARISLTVGSEYPIDEAYHYSVFAIWSDVLGGSNPYHHDHYSNKYEFIRRPVPPQSSLSSGTYSGSQSVVLYTTEEGADPYFILIGDNTTLGGKYVPGHPIPVTEDSFLYAYTRKNDVDSMPVEFLYKITAAPIGGGVVVGGGGGGGGLAPAGGGAPAGGDAGAGVTQPKVTTGADGSKNAEFTPDAAKLLAGLQANSSEVTIDAQTSEPVDRLTLNLDAGLIRAANE
ncbi:MAG: serine protease, partial [Paenibacillaceae bacterium]|nr:serine protease [Paenibacillaceae bacterium]